MPSHKLNPGLPTLLKAFEETLDPIHHERSGFPLRVLGYGEISTVLEIDAPGMKGCAFKRMPMFQDRGEAERYTALHTKYVRALEEHAGLRVAASEIVSVDTTAGRIVLYIVQQSFAPESVCHRLIHRLSAGDVVRLVCAALRESYRVFSFNREHRGELELGFDAQMSNWVLLSGWNPASSSLGPELSLAYLDTSTPLLRAGGQEQLDPELFLRNAPSFLAWVIRTLFLQDVMNRYYDFRRVVLDLVANFYKEQLPQLVPALVPVVNQFCVQELVASDFAPLTEREVRAYYREDAWIWRLYLAARKIDRSWHRARRKDYPHMLPGRIKR